MLNGAQENADLDLALIKAAAAGEIEAVTSLLDAGAGMSAVNQFGHTALRLAALFGRDAIVRILLDRGANVNAVSDNGNSALHWAAFFGHTDTVRILLERGADLDAVNLHKRSPLHFAASERHVAIVNILLDRCAKVEPNFDSHDGSTSFIKILKTLLSAMCARAPFKDDVVSGRRVRENTEYECSVIEALRTIAFNQSICLVGFLSREQEEMFKISSILKDDLYSKLFNTLDLTDESLNGDPGASSSHSFEDPLVLRFESGQAEQSASSSTGEEPEAKRQRTHRFG